MSESSLADEFERQVKADSTNARLGTWAWRNRDRILAALRGNEEDARIARIVREPSDGKTENARVQRRLDEHHARGYAPVYRDGWDDRTADILALANEAGERERQG